MFRLILAGILALPALFLSVITAPILAILSIPSLWLLLARKQQNNATDNKNVKKKSTNESTKDTNGQQNQNQRQIVITGGSSGIGLSIAKCCAASDSNDVSRIVLVARNVDKLNKAKQQVEEVANKSNANKNIEVVTVSVDVTDAEEIDKVMKNTIMIDTTTSLIKTHLFCCAGIPYPSKYQDVSPTTYRQICQVNQLGTIYVVNSCLKHGLNSGTITLTSSMGGQVGIYGFSAYSPTKFALRGYAECLHMELLSDDVHVQIAYPPDTDTPGFLEENKIKPYETRLISEVAGLMSSDNVGQIMYQEACLTKNPKFSVYFNFDGLLLCTLTSGFSPVTTLIDAIWQVSILNISRWIALFYLADWHRILKKNNNNDKDKDESNDDKDTTTKEVDGDDNKKGSYGSLDTKRD